ncbi:MAG: hypothetical protein NTY02_05370 [Acidobacteria bacterium]|nr:hypothetical protein [Acidobacteriota bacterium]
METQAQSFVHYFPLGTTLISAVFSAVLFRKFLQRRSPQLFWWAFGVACYGSGTVVESLITLGGNSVVLTKAWYITGALLGGYPLAQGSVYLSHSRKFGDRATAITLPVVIIASILVVLSPVRMEMLEATRPTGAILGWTWIRLITPFINIYASFFLIGGAAWSAWKYFKKEHAGHRAAGNAFIALGALMPGIGGSMAKAGYVEVLYVLEFIGLILIWIGDRVCSRAPDSSRNSV